MGREGMQEYCTKKGKQGNMDTVLRKGRKERMVKKDSVLREKYGKERILYLERKGWEEGYCTWKGKKYA